MPDDPKYLSVSDTNLRIVNSVIRYKEKFYWCKLLDDLNNRVRLFNLSDSQEYVDVSANDPDINVTSPELGWMKFQGEYPGQVLFVSRAPYRKQKQGISSENLVYQDPYNISAIQTISNSTVQTKGFADMLYAKSDKTYSELIEELKKVKVHVDLGYYGIPFCTRFLFLKRNTGVITLLKRTTEIGVFRDDSFVLHERYRNSLNTMILSNLGVLLKDA